MLAIIIFFAVMFSLIILATKLAERFFEYTDERIKNFKMIVQFLFVFGIAVGALFATLIISAVITALLKYFWNIDVFI